MRIDLIFAHFVDLMEKILFFSIGNIPLIIAWLVLASLFFTLRFGLIGIRGFKHALDIAQGKYDTEEGLGEVSAFQALATALSGTVGLGNIAGVAIADLGSVVDFSDMMLLAMALPNIFGCLLLSNQVAKKLSNYWLKLNLLAIERQKN